MQSDDNKTPKNSQTPPSKEKPVKGEATWVVEIRRRMQMIKTICGEPKVPRISRKK